MASTTTGLPNVMSTYYDKRFLERAKEMIRHDFGAQERKLSRNEGKTVIFNRFSPLAKATTPLTEATNPSFVDMTSTQVSATVAPYGNAAKVGELFELTSIDVNLEEHVDTMAQNAAETIDELIKAELDGGGTDQFAGGNSAISDVASSDVVTGAEIRQTVVTLKSNKAPLFEDGMYRAIIPVTSAYDLRGNSEWLDAHRYTDASAIKNGEIGQLHGVRFRETNNEQVNASAGSSNADIYSTFVFGREAYGMVSLEGQPESRIYIKQSGPQDTSNPLDMFSTIGWKAYHVSKVLNSSWLVELQAGTASA